jgi:hypothetical protein
MLVFVSLLNVFLVEHNIGLVLSRSQRVAAASFTIRVRSVILARGVANAAAESCSSPKNPSNMMETISAHGTKLVSIMGHEFLRCLTASKDLPLFQKPGI